MTALKVIITLIYVVVCIALTIIVLMQEGKSEGLSALNGSGSGSYWEKNKGRSLQGTLSKVTKILAAAFILLSLVLNVLF